MLILIKPRLELSGSNAYVGLLRSVSLLLTIVSILAALIRHHWHGKSSERSNSIDHRRRQPTDLPGFHRAMEAILKQQGSEQGMSEADPERPA